MTRFYGKGVCGGVAIGKVQQLKRAQTDHTKRRIDDTNAELHRLEAAITTARIQLLTLSAQTKAQLGDAEAQIFEIHAMMLEDVDFTEAITDCIRNEQCNAEYAVESAAKAFAQNFAAMDDTYMQARAADVKDIGERLLRCLSDAESTSNPSVGDCILCADDLSPSETAELSGNAVLGFATAHGSTGSHTAILARSMNIPAIVGLGTEFLSSLHDGDTLLLDGDTGECIVSPDAQTIRNAEEKQNRITERMAALHILRNVETVTADGKKIALYANIGNVNDMQQALQNGAEGIGLYRSEFLYLQQPTLPNEEVQYRAYRQMLEQMPNQKVVIRTLDIGADKQVSYLQLEHEENPALGLRGIRLCLARPELLRTQLRALYRASIHGRLCIMFPMITTAEELQSTLSVCKDVRETLQAEKSPFSNDVEHGIMIETPSAAILSSQLAKQVDFFSIGTNDLTQYTLACDRQNPKLEYLHAKPAQAVNDLIAYTVKNAHSNGIWVGICGELAAHTELTKNFIALGVDELSVSPKDILPMREHIRNLHMNGSH